MPLDFFSSTATLLTASPFHMDPTTYAVIAIALAAISEALSLYPRVRANGIIQALLLVSKTLFPKR